MKELLATISKREWAYVLFFSLAVVVIVTFPYIFAYFNVPPGTVYNGLHSLSPGDPPIYFSYINQVKTGDYLFEDYFTSENQEIGFFNISWLIVGLFAKIFIFTPALAFHVFRILLIPALIVVSYLLIAYFFKETNQRKFTLIILALSSGLGFYFAPLAEISQYYFHSTDLWVAESNLFLTMYQSPHFIMSYIMMFLIILLILLSFDHNKFRYSIIAGILALIYFNFHPFYFLTIFLILSLYLLALFIQNKKIGWQKVSHVAIIFVISLPSIFYHIWLIKTVPVLYTRATQNIVVLDSLWIIILGYGLLWLFSGFTIYKLIKSNKYDEKKLFLVAWLAAILLLVVIPTQFQSRFLQSLIFPLAVLACTPLYLLYKKLNNKLLAVVLFLLLIAPTNLFVIAKDIYYFSNGNSNFYLPDEKVEAWRWLDQYIPDKGVVLAPLFDSLFIPAYADQKVYAAHEIETLYFKNNKKILNQWFYLSKVSCEQKDSFLERNKINYVIFNKKENDIGQCRLKEIYNQENISIYQFVGN
ncbi:hypothetical protein KKA15_03115 [Patescibacteria group bacterium]|nr:hypothetical protein [Patescibacteria group bacterium]